MMMKRLGLNFNLFPLLFLLQAYLFSFLFSKFIVGGWKRLAIVGGWLLLAFNVGVASCGTFGFFARAPFF
jgi:hypothetical protein